MNNETVVTVLSSQEYIYDEYLGLLQLYATFGCFALLIYASLLHFTDEVKYIWKRKFTLPTYLYFLSKYPVFFYFSVCIVDAFWPAVESFSLCNAFSYIIQAINVLPFIGVQGLISIRTYSLCQGYRPMSIALSITFLTALTMYMYTITLRVCTAVPQIKYFLTDSMMNISIFLSDILAFITVIWQVWGLWRLKRGLGLQSHQDLIGSILRQGILRFSFVLLVSTVLLLLGFLSSNVAIVFAFFQNTLSTILMCELTLDLRRRNTPRSISNPSAVDLSTLSFREDPVNSVRSVLGQFHESIVVEMGERDDINNNDALNLGAPDDLPNDPSDINLDFVEDRGEDSEPPVQDA